MKIVFIVSIITLLVLSIVLFVKKQSIKNPVLKRRFLYFGMGCGLVSIIALLAAFYISHDYSHFYKMALPMLIMFNVHRQLKALEV